MLSNGSRFGGVSRFFVRGYYGRKYCCCCGAALCPAAGSTLSCPLHRARGGVSALPLGRGAGHQHRDDHAVVHVIQCGERTGDDCADAALSASPRCAHLRGKLCRCGGDHAGGDEQPDGKSFDSGYQCRSGVRACRCNDFVPAGQSRTVACLFICRCGDCDACHLSARTGKGRRARCGVPRARGHGDRRGVRRSDTGDDRLFRGGAGYVLLDGGRHQRRTHGAGSLYPAVDDSGASHGDGDCTLCDAARVR